MTDTTGRNRLPEMRVLELNGNWTLRFSWKGKTLKKSFGRDKKSKALAELTGSHCLQALSMGNFSGNISDYVPGHSSPTPKRSEKPIETVKPVSLLDTSLTTLERYLSHLEETSASHSHKVQYRVLINNLKSCGMEWFTQNQPRYLGLLKTAFRFCKVTIPDDLPTPKKKQQTESNLIDDVFTPSEVERILEWFESSKDYSHYLPFVKFRFLTGTRPSEAIALSWNDVNLEKGLLTIRNSYSEKEGLKGRKNKEITYLPLNNSLRSLLESQTGLHPTLVFPSPKGGYINLRNFSQRCWQRLREDLGVDKVFYNIRHTVLSKIAREQGYALAARVAGHKNTAMVIKHYEKVVDMPTLPELA